MVEVPERTRGAFRDWQLANVCAVNRDLDRLAGGVKAQSTAKNGDVVVARVDDQVTLQRYFQTDERSVELKPESTKSHPTIIVDLKNNAFEICGVAVGALIGDGFNRLDWWMGRRGGSRIEVLGGTSALHVHGDGPSTADAVDFAAPVIPTRGTAPTTLQYDRSSRFSTTGASQPWTVKG